MSAHLMNKKDLFYKEEEIKDELKCFACQLTFDDPCILPCGDSVCFGCVFVNEKNEVNNNNRIKEIVENFTCPVCQEIHTNLNPILLPRNKVLQNLLNKKAKEIYRNQSVEELKSILTEIESILPDFQSTLQQPAAKIEQYCHSLEIEVDLKVEQEIQSLRKWQEELHDKIDKFKQKALENVSVTSENEELAKQIEQYSNHVNETSEFVERTYEYLKEYRIDDQQVQKAIQFAKENLQKMRENFKTYSQKHLINKEDIEKLFDSGRIQNSRNRRKCA
jgi:chromosome segregation ATPase